MGHADYLGFQCESTTKQALALNLMAEAFWQLPSECPEGGRGTKILRGAYQYHFPFERALHSFRATVEPRHKGNLARMQNRRLTGVVVPLLLSTRRDVASIVISLDYWRRESRCGSNLGHRHADAVCRVEQVRATFL